MAETNRPRWVRSTSDPLVMAWVHDSFLVDESAVVDWDRLMREWRDASKVSWDVETPIHRMYPHEMQVPEGL